MMRFASIALVMTAFLFGQKSGADAADLYDNIGQTVNNESGLNNSSWGALSFRTTATDFVITAVNIPIKNHNSWSSGNIILSLYTATGTGSSPGTKIGADLGSTPIAGYSSSVYQNFSITGLSVTLSPSTNYYLVISSSGVPGNYSVGLNSTGGGLVTGSLGWSDTLNAGSSWGAPSTSHYFIGSVTATVPEPSTCILGAIATGTAAVLIRRRKPRLA